ncbi:MAG: PQQ-dependent sugar dehydrogenase [Planctomycetes bacterium]|nr:PQQ-dependent sugar dehydrogenase [Planctomycetota bacterium]MCB9885383.1 PQQ-dependent sugar dehydrogenase [Planctomycetota bacterium]
MAAASRIAGAALAALLAGCSGSSGPGSDYGIAARTEVAPLPLPTGLPTPIPVQWTEAFPALLFDRPVFLVAPPDGSDRVVVGDQSGRIQIFANDPFVTSATMLLDLRGQVQYGGEEGLLGFAFHPDYATTGWLYVYYTAGNPRRSILSRFSISPGDANVADPASETILLEVEEPFGNHNSGALAFGPDGKLYVACGDGGSANDPLDNAQNLQTLLGNILRLNDDGSVPGDNPFVGGSNGERPEIWAYGLRNPWRMSFDRVTGQLWVGDVGQDEVEEVDLITRGGNYGWPVYEGELSNRNPGALPPTAFVQPVQTYHHYQGRSITGGYVYRGSAVPALVGAYVYTDFTSGRVWALVHDGDQTVSNTQIASVTSPASFGEDEAGELYVCCFDGRIRKLLADAGGGPVTAIPTTLSATGLFADTAMLRPAPGVIEYDVNAPLWSDDARKRRWLALPGSSRIGFDATAAWTFAVGTALVKHFEIETAPGVTLRLETRVLLRQESGWVGFTYRWNGAGTDADLVGDVGDQVTFAVDDGLGGSRSQTWRFPARAECLQCHTSAAGHVLGVRTRQLNRDFDFPVRTDNQLRTWSHLQLFTTDIGAHEQHPAYVDPLDAAAPLDDRARAWLAVNCANCHLPLGPTSVDLDLRFGVAATAMQLFGVGATTAVPGGSGQRAVAGAHAQSDLWLRITRRDAYGMPPLGSNLVHDAGAQLLADWIDSDPTTGN